MKEGERPDVPVLALRADIDALPIPDTKADCPYRSTVPDRAHACGHDMHTTIVLGTGLVLADLHEKGLLTRPVRLIFQPAEEVLPGGALGAIEDGVLNGVGRILAVHCDPRVDAYRVGLRHGPITSACDRLEVLLDGPGGHTARPHLTTDLVTAAARVAVDVPALIARRVDTRVGLALTWGRIESGHAPNVVPQHAELSGTVRCLDLEAWRQAPDIVHAAIDEVATMHRAKSEINYVRGVPPVVNDKGSAELLRRAMAARRGGTPWRAPSRASAARTSPGTWSTYPAPWPASASAAPASARSATCTRATSTPTSTPSRSAWRCSPRPRSWTTATSETTATTATTETAATTGTRAATGQMAGVPLAGGVPAARKDHPLRRNTLASQSCTVRNSRVRGLGERVQMLFASNR